MKRGPKPRPIAERFWEKVDGGSIDECLIWHGTVRVDGYGIFYVSPGVKMKPHRWVYEHLVCEIPAGLVIDHLCRQTLCVNPWHLEPVTNEVNLKRSIPRCSKWTHCGHGHEFTPENTAIQAGRPGKKRRRCRICQLARGRRRRRPDTKEPLTSEAFLLGAK